MMIARLALLTVLITTVAFSQAPAAGETAAAPAPEPAATGAEPAAADATAEPTPGAPPAAPPPAEPAPEPPRGDTLTLKSGQVIQGMQILRATSTSFVVEVIQGVTLNVPRRQVVSVDYDDFDPLTAKRKGESTLIRGQRISEALQKKLDAVLADPPLSFENTELIQITDEVNRRAGGVIMLDPSVAELPAESRTGSVSSQPGATLGAFLRTELLAKFPELVMSFEGDKVVLKSKAAAAASGVPSEVPPGAPPTPGAGPAAPPPPGGEPPAPPAPPAPETPASNP